MPPLTSEYDDLAVAPLADPLPDRRRCSASSGIVVGDPQQLRAVHRPGADAGRVEPRDHRRPRHRRPAEPTRPSGELYVYAGAIVLGTVVQVLLPLPWLRGLDGRLRVALDYPRPRRPARLRPDDPRDDQPRADQPERGDRDVRRGRATSTRRSRRTRSTRRSASTCCRRGCSRSRSRPCSSRALAASRRAHDLDGFRATVAPGIAADRLPARARERQSARCSRNRSSASSTSAASSTPDQTPVVASASRGVLARARRSTG